MDGLPKTRCLAVAIATPLTRDFHPDTERLIARARMLMSLGCDGITLFGTTGEGAEFSVEDRTSTLEAVIAAGIPADRLVASVGALNIPDTAKLAAHATAQGVAGVLLMPPSVYRGGISEDGTFRYFCAIIDRVAMSDLRLYLYHFPDICGTPITPQVVRRLDERYPGMIAGVKDSGGDLDFTLDLVRRFSHLSIFTGSEIHLPEVIQAGGRGTVCGLANVMPRLMRGMCDGLTAFDRRALLPLIFAGDAILSRRPFIPSAKAVVADWLGDAEWRRTIPPLPEYPAFERTVLVADFRKWDANLPEAWRSIAVPDETPSNVVGLRRA